MNVIGGLERLLQFGRDLGRGVLVTPVDASVECANLYQTVAALQESAPIHSPLVDSLTLEKARRHWRECRPDISRLHNREIRILCWDPTTAMTTDFVKAIGVHPLFFRKRVWIEGMASCYFDSWRTMERPELLEAVLGAAARQPAAGKSWLAMCGSHSSDIFSSQAHVFLARSALDRRQPIEYELGRWNLAGRSSRLREATFEAAIEEWLRRYSLLFEGNSDWLTEASLELDVLLKEILPFAAPNSRQYYHVISHLILSKSAARDGVIQKQLQAWILTNSLLGDPRHPSNLSKWNLVTPDAMRLFKSWLAKGDLLFFFEAVIPDREDPHGRKPFWLQYINQVEDSSVALCAKDRERLERADTEKFSYARVADSFDVSAFLMRFRTREGDIIVIEFSKTGNAIYIHHAPTFEKHIGSLRSAQFRVGSSRGLRHETKITKLDHRGQWQREVRAYLASEHGIRPR